MSTFYFTFGIGHKLVSVCDDFGYDGQVAGQAGIPLAGRYVTVRAADEMSAREKMIEVFGRAWSSVYTAPPHGAHGYEELMRL